MSWETPKTDWEETDYINYWDINRIINNLNFLHDLATSLFIDISDFETMVEKSEFTQYRYASEINAIEQNLEQINEETHKVDIGETQTYYPNLGGFDYKELNRIESMCLDMYGRLNNQHDGRRMFIWNFGMSGGL